MKATLFTDVIKWYTHKKQADVSISHRPISMEPYGNLSLATLF